VRKSNILRDMNIEQLQYELTGFRSELLDKSLRRVGESSDGGPSKGELRRNVARVLTLIREKSGSQGE
jgi:ribosomal protein L29